jgi:hypothetical protein
MEIIDMRIPRSLLYVVALALGLAGWTASAQAVVLDWDTAAWAPGATSRSFNVDVANPGNDLTVAFTGATDKFRNDPTTGSATPSINQSLEGGMNPVQKSLNLGVDFHQNSTITCTVNFSALYTLGVENVSFTIFNIDFFSSGPDSWQDVIKSISAVSADGVTIVAPTISNIGPAVTLGGGLNPTLTGNALVPDTGAGSGAGNVTISFGAPIRSFTFTYADGVGSKPNPTFQNISIGDISFTPVPEINPAISAAVSCLFAVGLTVFVQRRARLRRDAR